MPPLRRADDPYRILGIARGADLDQIKAAHRRLAKRFHPDRATGDEQRFLAVQEAYKLLSDPTRRGEWDRRHPSGGKPAERPRKTAAPDEATAARGEATAARREATAAQRRARARAVRPQPPPGRRTTTWSAEHVPWWQDFRPEARSRDNGADRGERSGTAGPEQADTAPDQALDLDVFSRSSGAAWSMAARRHFRRGDADLPSRGTWRYRGSQVVTGAEARKVAAEEAIRGRRRAGRGERGRNEDMER